MAISTPPYLHKLIEGYDNTRALLQNFFPPILGNKDLSDFVAVSVAGYLDDREIHHLAHISKWAIDELMDPIHALFEAMIRREHTLEAQDGWREQSPLEGRLQALGRAKELSKAYFTEQNLLYWCNQLPELYLKRLMHPNVLCETPLADFHVSAIGHFLVHIANFSDEALKKHWLEWAQQTNPSGCKTNTFAELAERLFQAYGTSVEEVIDLLAREVSEELLPHLADPDSLFKGVEHINDRVRFFLGAGKAPYLHAREKPSGRFELMKALLDKPPTLRTGGAFWIVPRPSQELDPLVNVALTAFRQFHQDPKRQPGPLLSVASRQVRCIPTRSHAISVFHQPEVRLLQKLCAFCASSCLKSSMTNACTAGAGLIEDEILLAITKAGKMPAGEERNQYIAGHLEPLIAIARTSREALLWTFLAGYKKQVPSSWWSFSPSHFHPEFSAIFVQGLFELATSLLKEHAVPSLRDPIPQVTHLPSIVSKTKAKVTEMTEQFSAKK